MHGSLTGEGDYGDDKLADVIAWLQARLAEIPEAYRDEAYLSVDSVGGYEGEHHAEIEVYWERPEDDAEKAARLKQERLRRISHEQQERAALAALKAKYED